MEPRWEVIVTVLCLVFVVVVSFLLLNAAYSIWVVFSENIVLFLSRINDIGDKSAGWNNELKGVLALGMIEALILGVIVIISRNLGR